VGVSPFKTTRTAVWTRERVERLGRQEVLQLQANAVRLAEPELVALCSEVLKHLPARGPASKGAGAHGQARLRLIARTKAFEARGVWLQDVRASWSGVRKSDGLVVFALWARAIESRDGGCCCLLWAPNAAGARPWSDSAAGRERLEHCKEALAQGRAEAPCSASIPPRSSPSASSSAATSTGRYGARAARPPTRSPPRPRSCNFSRNCPARDSAPNPAAQAQLRCALFAADALHNRL